MGTLLFHKDTDIVLHCNFKLSIAKAIYGVSHKVLLRKLILFGLLIRILIEIWNYKLGVLFNSARLLSLE